MIRRFALSALVLVTFAALSVAACSDSSDPAPGSADAGAEGGSSTTADGGTGGGDSGASDEDAGPVNACRTFADRTGASASRTITWSFAISSAPERCMQIKAGQTVTFSNGSGGAADFTTYPLVAQGGDTPNPISGVDTDTGAVTFPSAGTYGFACSEVPAMLGAILVTP